MATVNTMKTFVKKGGKKREFDMSQNDEAFLITSGWEVFISEADIEKQLKADTIEAAEALGMKIGNGSGVSKVIQEELKVAKSDLVELKQVNKEYDGIITTLREDLEDAKAEVSKLKAELAALPKLAAKPVAKPAKEATPKK